MQISGSLREEGRGCPPPPSFSPRAEVLARQLVWGWPSWTPRTTWDRRGGVQALSTGHVTPARALPPPGFCATETSVLYLSHIILEFLPQPNLTLTGTTCSLLCVTGTVLVLKGLTAWCMSRLSQALKNNGVRRSGCSDQGV